jgi:hypothetical protein
VGEIRRGRRNGSHSFVCGGGEEVWETREAGCDGWINSNQAAAYSERMLKTFRNIVATVEVSKHYLTPRGLLFSRRELDEWFVTRDQRRASKLLLRTEVWVHPLPPASDQAPVAPDQGGLPRPSPRSTLSEHVDRLSFSGLQNYVTLIVAHLVGSEHGSSRAGAPPSPGCASPSGARAGRRRRRAASLSRGRDHHGACEERRIYA